MVPLGFVLAALAAVAVPYQQQAATPPAAQHLPADVALTGDAAVVINHVRSDKADEFETVMARLKEALQKSTVAERRQQAAGWKVFKSSEGAGDGEVLYLWVIDPVVKGADYSVPKILSEAFPAQAKALYDAYAGAFAARGRVIINGKLVASMGQ